MISIQRNERNKRKEHNAKINTASIFGFWPLRQQHLTIIVAFVAYFLRSLRAVRLMETRL